MKRALPSAIVSTAACVAAGAAWWLVPLPALAPAFPALVSSLALLAGAVLVRMARSAPITSYASFDETDLSRFFDTLDILAKRLFFLFVQIMFAMFVVIVAIVLSAVHDEKDKYLKMLDSVAVAAIAGGGVWLAYRLLGMVQGDIGFLHLQREILENALKRERQKEAANVVSSQVTRISPGRYGSKL